MKDIDADLWRQHIGSLTVAALYYSYVDELILRIVYEVSITRIGTSDQFSS